MASSGLITVNTPTNLLTVLNQARKESGLSYGKLAERAHASAGSLHRIMHGIYHGLFKPSRPRAIKMARYFGDEERLLLILCDLESAPSNIKDKVTAELLDLYTVLTADQQAEARRYLKYLRDQKP